MTRALLVVGQSHVAAFRAAARTRRERDPHRPRTRVIHTGEPRYAPEMTGDAEPVPGPVLAAAIADQIARHDPLLVSVTGGNAHSVLGLIRHERPFDFRLADGGGPPFDEGSEPIPLASMRATLGRALDHDLRRMRTLARVAGPFVQVESPPPLADARLIAERADAWFREAGIAARGIAGAGLRWRLWRLANDLLAEEAARLGWRFLPVPPSLTDADGFLPAALAADATHGNEAYGHALIEALGG